MNDNGGPLDLTEDIIAYENGELDEDETIAFFQQLIDAGLAWELEGGYERAAHELIDLGLCHLPERAG